MIISHGSNGEYGHPGHQTVFRAVEKLVNESNEDLIWYTVQAFFDNAPKPHLLNRDDPADWVLDTTALIDKKIKAAYCHKSQHALFLRKKSKELGRMVSIEDVIVPLESYHLKNGQSDILSRLSIISNNVISK